VDPQGNVRVTLASPTNNAGLHIMDENGTLRVAVVVLADGTSIIGWRTSRVDSALTSTWMQAAGRKPSSSSMKTATLCRCSMGTDSAHSGRDGPHPRVCCGEAPQCPRSVRLRSKEETARS